MKKLWVLSFLIAINLSASAQIKLIKKLLSNEKDTTRKASFMPIPVLGFAQETGFEFGLGGIYSYYADKTDLENRSSGIRSTMSYSTNHTYSILVKGDLWSKKNLYHTTIDLKLKRSPFSFYGIGNNTEHSNEDKLVQKNIRAMVDVEKTFVKNFYTGLSLGYEYFKITDSEPLGYFDLNPFYGKHGGEALFVGLSQSYDTRNSNNYPTQGFFGRVSYQYAPKIFKGENFNGSQLKVNLRNFWTLSPKFVLGLQTYYHGFYSKNTPFYLLPQLGNDELMRGYYSGRYRDNNLLAAQTELRYRYNSRFGAVLFAGTGTVWGEQDLKLADFKPNYGAGLRYFFDPEKGLSVRLDYGLGEKRSNEKRQSGFYISFAEAF